jgi:hypothetical protein
MGRRRRRWQAYVLRGLDNNAGFGTRVMGANARGCQNGASMSSADCQWLRGGKQVDDRAYSGGNTLVGASSSTGDRGGWARVRQHSGVVAVARGGIPVEVTKLSPVYDLLSLSRSFFLVFLCTPFHKGETVYVLQLLGCRDNKREDVASQNGNPKNDQKNV